MSSLVEMQYQQHFPQQQTQPLSLAIVQKEPKQQEKQEQQEQQTSYLAAVSGNNYAYLRRAARRQRQQQQQIRRHMQPYRQLVGASTNNHGGYSSGPSSGYSGPYVGYGGPSTGSDYNNYNSNSQHGSNGGAYMSYQPNTASGYGDAAPPQTYHPPANQAPIYHAPVYSAPKPVKGRSKNKKGDTTLSALTLLSFFFFVNLLQNCLKEHMNDINPTVMVMTVNGGRNRFNKLAEMNSREQSAAAATVFPAAAASLQNAVLLAPGDLIAAASSHSEPSMAIVQSPYSSNIMDPNKAITIETTQHYNYNNNNNNNNNKQHGNKNNAYTNKEHNNKYNDEYEQLQHSSLLSNQSVRPEFYDSVDSYSKRNNTYSYPTSAAASNNVFSTYIRSSGSSLADKSHNYSFHRRAKPTFQTQKDLDQYDDASHIESSYFSDLGSTPMPKSYWSLAAKSSSTSDFYEHHTDDFVGDDNNDFNIDRRYSADSA